jgi:hypothetical protein
MSSVMGADGNPLPQWAVDNLAKSGIPANQIVALGIRYVDPSEYMDLFGVSGDGLPDAYLIPGHDPITGEQMLSEDGKPFNRAKLRYQVHTKDGTLKYLSRAGGGQRAYFPPGVAQQLKGAKVIPSTEGEKKAICANNLGIGVIGLTGNYGWQGPDGGLLPEIVSYAEGADTFIFIADSDAANNPAFGDAMRAFAYALGQYNCKLCYCVLPPVIDDGKTGLDDFLLHHGADGVEALNKWVNANSREIEGSERFAKIGAKDWQTPQPLVATLAPALPWPWDAMPGPLANFGQAVVATMDAYPPMVGLCILAAVSIALGNKCKVQIKAGHLQFPIIYGMAVLPPAGCKTPVGKAVIAPLDAWETEQYARYQIKIQQWDARRRIVGVQIKEVENQAKKKSCPQNEADRICTRIQELEASLGPRPVEPRLYGNDATSEAIARRVLANNGCFGIFASEARKFIIVCLGVYRGGTTDIDIYLAGHGGDSCRVERANSDRSDIVLPEVCLALSKSKYMVGLQCPKLLWTHYNARNLIPAVDAGTQARFDEGHKVGGLAKQLYPGGIEVTWDNDVASTVRQSQALLGQGKPLFEASFLANGVYARADILEPVGRGRWDLIEVKSSTEVKSVHIPDLAVQRYCYEAAGVRIRRCHLLHINNEYVLKGAVNPVKLFKREDVTDVVKSVSSEVPDRILEMQKTIARGSCPEVDIGPQCSDPYPCPLAEDCWKAVNACQNNVFTLYHLRGEKKWALYQQGILDNASIGDAIALSDAQQIQIATERIGKLHVDRVAVQAFLDLLRYPLQFLDFETFSTAIPMIQGTRPYQQIPFQFSLHTVPTPSATPQHNGWIWDGQGNPFDTMLHELGRCMGTCGSVIAYNAGFEISRLQEAAKACPGKRAWVSAVVARMVDLLVPFRAFDVYHPVQHGSASMKSVLPALTCTDYSSLAISDGGMASQAYLDAMYGGVPEAQKQQTLKDLEVYCGQDTMGMVDILRKLGEIAA